MPRYKRPRRESTDDYQQLALWANGPEHRTFELIRPCVLFGQSPAERARETGAAERTIGLSTTKPGKSPLSGMSITGTRPNLGSWIIPRQVLGPNVPGFWPSEVQPALILKPSRRRTMIPRRVFYDELTLPAVVGP